MGVPLFRSAAATAYVALLTGCQTYRPEPFDAERFGQVWRARGQADAADGRPPVTSTTQATPRQSLTLDQAQALALLYNPALRVARLRAGVTQARADNAGLWADPVLVVDSERIISGASDPWVIGGVANLTIPLSGRLEAEKRRAKAEHAAELTRVAGQEWAMRQRLATAWAEWSTQQARLDLLDTLARRLDDINRVTDRLAAAGALSRLQSRLFRIERDTRQAERIEASARSVELRLDLLAMLGLTPDAAVSFETAALPATVAVGDAPWAERNFDTRAAMADYEQAERTLEREVRAQYPDLVIGPGFGVDEETDRVLLGLSLPLPLWNRNRQGVAEALAHRRLARVQLETTIEAQTSAVATTRARLDAAVRQREAYESTIVPAADEQAAEAGRLADLGDVDAVLLLDAFVRQYQVRVQLLDVRLAEVRASARLAELAGDAPPHTDARPVKEGVR